MRGASIASTALIPWSTTLRTICRIAARRRIEPALPTTSRGVPPSRTSEGAIMLVSLRPAGPAPGGVGPPPAGFFFGLAPVPGPDAPGPAAGGGGGGGGVPGRVDD